MDTKERIDFLRKEIEDHNYSYYILDKPLISDFEFDQLMSELISLEDQYPQFSSEHSPSNKVGGGVVDSFRSVQHLVKRYYAQCDTLSLSFYWIVLNDLRWCTGSTLL